MVRCPPTIHYENSRSVLWKPQCYYYAKVMLREDVLQFGWNWNPKLLCNVMQCYATWIVWQNWNPWARYLNLECTNLWLSPSEPVKESECFVMEPDGVGPLLLLKLDELYSQWSYPGSLHNIIRFTVHQLRYICWISISWFIWFNRFNHICWISISWFIWFNYICWISIS